MRFILSILVLISFLQPGTVQAQLFPDALDALSPEARADHALAKALTEATDYEGPLAAA